MTSEVCIMNRLAVVLAADSATTVTYWNGTKEEQRYFKGANKIFQLSNLRPIGVMIFDSASLLDVPWEVVVKEFRLELADKSYDHVEHYANAFFDFLDANTLLFPLDVRRRHFVSGVTMATLRTIGAANAVVPDNDPDPAATTASALQSRLADLSVVQFPPCSDAGKLNNAAATHSADIIANVEKFLVDFSITFHGSVDLAVQIALMDVMKSPNSFLSTTGIVFAGFGDKDVFPTTIEYQSCCYLSEDHAELKKNEVKIDHTSPARLLPFAQASMAETFRMGMSQTVFVSLMGAVADETDQLIQAAVTASGGQVASIPDLPGMLKEARDRIGDKVLEDARNENAYPLQRVISSLPIDEMANLAETLINLQSLKERVTKPSESVGGPVDVAAITRSEGLVWIRRKHYFPDDLNRRFQQRQNALYK